MDQCTHDARYSLSEDRLLREAVAAGVVRCCVVQDELEEDVVVRVLDCDSISQVSGHCQYCYKPLEKLNITSSCMSQM